uniref:Uncharacterized protein n=1 Tax=Plectus sambesii TaxID=2011161 RepID=A0A914XLL0_9BILA
MLGLQPDFEGGRVTSNILGILEGDHWKNVRTTITPAFTTGKMKNMVPIFNDCMKIFGEIATEYTNSGKPMDLKKLCGGFALDVIAKSAFGMDIDAQRGNSSSPFIKYAFELLNITPVDPKIMILLLFPNTIQLLEKIFKFQYFFAEGDEFFKNLLHAMIEERQKIPKKTNPDFMQLLLNAMRDPEGEMEVDKEIAHEETASGKRVKLTELEIMSQLLIFLLAGYETTATTLHFALYMLAMHPEVQDKLVDEIHEVIGQTDEILYEHIGKFTYLDQVISETLRMFPALPRIDRDCSKDVVINDVKIPKGCAVGVPVWVIHYDPEIYPNPQTFDPERFSPEEKANRDPLAYLPFGYGPRNCIGMRFAQLEMRMALAYLVKNFKFVPSEPKQKLPVKLILQGITKPASPLYVTVEKRT